MKLEQTMKRYYRSALGRVDPPGLSLPALKGTQSSLFRRIVCSDMMLNALVNGAIAAVLVAGFIQYRQESVLAGVLRRHAEELSLDRRLDAGVRSLSGHMKIIRKSYH